MLGPEEVLAPALQGGRSPRDRQQLSPWGERRTARRDPQLPWPGSIPPPAPARVFAEPRPALMLDADRKTVAVDARGLLSAPPAMVGVDGAAPLQIEAWAGPWPIDELWWDPARARQVARFQVVGVDGSAWLMVVEDGRWWAEARYD
jgi:protein ImuB